MCENTPLIRHNTQTVTREVNDSDYLVTMVWSKEGKQVIQRYGYW